MLGCARFRGIYGVHTHSGRWMMMRDDFSEIQKIPFKIFESFSNFPLCLSSVGQARSPAHKSPIS